MSVKLLELPTSDLLKKFGAGNHKPGSGSAAALLGLLSAHLMKTVIDLTKDPKRAKAYAQHLSILAGIESEIDGRLIPALERLFQADSDQFAKVIDLRIDREKASDPVDQKKLSDQAIQELVPATEMPLEVADICLALAEFGLEVFDRGFQAARGDSGVAINAALSAAAGCLSIVELNLLSFIASDWTSMISTSSKVLLVRLDALQLQAKQRLLSQIEKSKAANSLSLKFQEFTKRLKGKRSISELEIEALAVDLQRTLWVNKELIWKSNVPKTPFEVLKPEIALKSLGLIVAFPASLEPYRESGIQMDVAGQIDQQAKVVSISRQYPVDVQKFTAAHELGHSLLHSQRVIHRDKPLNGVARHETRGSEEWQADKFATFFLMPRKLVKQTFYELFSTDQFRISDNTAFGLGAETIRELRTRCKSLRGLSRLLAQATAYNNVHFDPMHVQFGVSIEAFAIRLEELELCVFSER